MVDDKKAASQGFFHCGIAAECALKAYIWHVERFNQWPDRESRKDLYTHDLRVLRKIAGIELDPKSATAPAWLVVLQWDRHQGYDPNPMPRKVARSMFEATFGKDGVVTWLRQSLNQNI